MLVRQMTSFAGMHFIDLSKGVYRMMLDGGHLLFQSRIDYVHGSPVLHLHQMIRPEPSQISLASLTCSFKSIHRDKTTCGSRRCPTQLTKSPSLRHNSKDRQRLEQK